MRTFTKIMPTFLLPPSSPKLISSATICITYPICAKLIFQRPTTVHYSVPTCVNNSEERETGTNLNDALSGMVGKEVEELLNREENRALLEGLDKASQRVELAKRELALIEKQELEAKQLRNYINQLETRALEIAKCQEEILEARGMVEEAERSLSIGADEDDFMDGKNDNGLDKDAERLESVKAASISALVGTFAGLPISITQTTTSSELVLPLAITFISCALFGVTFRYSVRRDLDNFQLKTGTSAAFAFVRGLAALEGGPPLELNPGSIVSHAFDGALHVSQSLLIFLFAAVGLDFCFKMRLLSPFPMKRPNSRTNTR